METFVSSTSNKNLCIKIWNECHKIQSGTSCLFYIKSEIRLFEFCGTCTRAWFLKRWWLSLNPLRIICVTSILLRFRKSMFKWKFICASVNWSRKAFSYRFMCVEVFLDISCVITRNMHSHHNAIWRMCDNNWTFISFWLCALFTCCHYSRQYSCHHGTMYVHIYYMLKIELAFAYNKY